MRYTRRWKNYQIARVYLLLEFVVFGGYALSAIAGAWYFDDRPRVGEACKEMLRALELYGDGFQKAPVEVVQSQFIHLQHQHQLQRHPTLN